MTQAVNPSTTSRFHNLSNEQLADALGRADAALKGIEAECALLKDEFKRRGLSEVAAENFTVTATGQFGSRLDTKAVREFLGASHREPFLSPSSEVLS